jgi:large subunit ribosomal protein L6
MSRVGNKPIEVPKGVSVEATGGAISVEGPKGALEQAVPAHILVALDDGSIRVTRDDDRKQTRAFHGMVRALLQNMVTGVTTGWKKELRIEGVGYSADVEGSIMNLRLGFSHPVKYDIPDGINVNVEKGNQITVEGIDRELVGHVAAVIRAFRKPDAYKGKGIRYLGEEVKLKPGKAAVT